MGALEDAFRTALSNLPAGVTVVTSSTREGTLRGATVTACMSLSLRPPLILCSLDHHARTLQAISEREHFAVHVLGAQHEAIAQRFAGAGDDKFAEVSYRLSEDGVPLLEDHVVRLECHVAARHVAGDHAIIVGAVDEVTSGDQGSPSPAVWYRQRLHRLQGHHQLKA